MVHDSHHREALAGHVAELAGHVTGLAGHVTGLAGHVAELAVMSLSGAYALLTAIKGVANILAGVEAGKHNLADTINIHIEKSLPKITKTRMCDNYKN